MGLVSVAFFYGTKQIFPYEEGTDIRGAGESITWEEFWQLPESPCKIKIKVKNEDDTYQHTVYIRLEVKKKEQLIAEQIAAAMAAFIKRLFGYI